MTDNADKLRGIYLECSTIKEMEIVTGEEKDNADSVKACRILIESRPGKESLIYTEVWLPDHWNGIFLGLGNGGYAGKIGAPFMNYAVQGYAVAQTDMGTSLVRQGVMIEGNPDVWEDYGERATHMMTLLSKKLIHTYYGKDPEYSYFIGASAGGLQALKEAQKFPEDYDGILAGVPSNSTICMLAYFLFLHMTFHDVSGKAQFTKEEVYQISLLAAKFFRERGDGEPGDDFITYPYDGEHTISDFLEYLKIHASFLTMHQLEILKTAYHGPINPKTGEQIFCGLPIGSEINCGLIFHDAENDVVPWPWPKLFFGKDFKERTYDFSDDLERMLHKIEDIFSANRKDLTRYKAHGGKLIMYSGSADPTSPWPDAVKYYNRVCDKMGGLEKVYGFFRHFIMPGMAHGNNGLGTNQKWADENRRPLLDALRDWREKDMAPDYLVGAHIKKEDENGQVKFVRKVYPYMADKKEGKDFPVCSVDRYLDWK